eukprot:gene156-biopygen22549
MFPTPPQICSLARDQLPEVIIPAACSCSSFRIEHVVSALRCLKNTFWRGFLWPPSGPGLGCLGDTNGREAHQTRAFPQARPAAPAFCRCGRYDTVHLVMAGVATMKVLRIMMQLG